MQPGFELNQGQFASQVKFLFRGDRYRLLLTANEAILAKSDAGAEPPLRMELTGANPAPRAVGIDPLPGRANYFIGNDPSRWRSDIPVFEKVRYSQV